MNGCLAPFWLIKKGNSHLYVLSLFTETHPLLRGLSSGIDCLIKSFLQSYDCSLYYVVPKVLYYALWFQLCDVPCTGAVSLRAHINGRNHKAVSYDFQVIMFTVKDLDKKKVMEHAH